MFTVFKHLYYLIEVTLFTLDLTAMLSGEDQVPRSLAYTENILQFLLICCLDFAGTWMGKFTELQITISKTDCGSLSFATFTSIINFDDKIKDSFTRGRLLPIVFFKTTADIIEVSKQDKNTT